jgi:hypothetical protein
MKKGEKLGLKIETFLNQLTENGVTIRSIESQEENQDIKINISVGKGSQIYDCFMTIVAEQSDTSSSGRGDDKSVYELIFEGPNNISKEEGQKILNMFMNLFENILESEYNEYEENA